ncbi:hypothetical protein SBRY_30651 [Actinacidiphila bryophytorum]|uniref:Uncharacterized protein n=1 Tax=Actinacidiphila bryophytorum TaxID=1436133 RepID=A0A9W4MH46_9ACTN|nr:hypothetical protein SBRY_30651 [Actinacidiphila bryophytorum]
MSVEREAAGRRWGRAVWFRPGALEPPQAVGTRLLSLLPAVVLARDETDGDYVSTKSDMAWVVGERSLSHLLRFPRDVELVRRGGCGSCNAEARSAAGVHDAARHGRVWSAPGGRPGTYCPRLGGHGARYLPAEKRVPG